MKNAPPTAAVHSIVDRVLAFFFHPTTAHTLAPIRIATGAMIAYIHLVWLMRIEDFMGPKALLTNDFWHVLHGGIRPDFKWTYLASTESMGLITFHEWLAVFSGLLVAVGLFTRTAIIVAWVLTLLTAHRLTGFLFGLDQIVIMLACYLCLAQSNSLVSLDRLLMRKSHVIRRSRTFGFLSGLGDQTATQPIATWNNTVCTRLIQLHLCVVYLFGGLGKLRGEMWWDGSAIWFSAAAYEYQSLDLTWIGHYPILGALFTHVTLFWEVLYPAVVWPKWTRPIAIGLAFCVHAGIGLFLGMITFGWMMIVANVAFIPPEVMRRIYPSDQHSPSPKS
jgi:hypothetical protein